MTSIADPGPSPDATGVFDISFVSADSTHYVGVGATISSADLVSRRGRERLVTCDLGLSLADGASTTLSITVDATSTLEIFDAAGVHTFGDLTGSTVVALYRADEGWGTGSIIRGIGNIRTGAAVFATRGAR